jgi:hypothetical protein
MKSYIQESYGTWNQKIKSSNFIFEDGAQPEADQQEVNSGVPEELKQDDKFKVRIIQAAERGEDFLSYGGSVYKVVKEEKDLKITKEAPKLNESFKTYFACLGGKLMECIPSKAGVFLRESIVSNDDEPATLSDDSTSDGTGEEIEAFLIKNVDGSDSDKIAIASKSLKGKSLTPSRGRDEYAILKLVIDNNNIPARRRAVEIKCETDILDVTAKSLYNAIKGPGTEEKEILNALEELNNTEDPGGNMLALLYMWDGNKFGIKASGGDAELPIFSGWSGAVLGVIAVAASGGTLAPLVLAGAAAAATANSIKFNRDTPIYDASDDTELSSNHRGLLMDIMEDMEDTFYMFGGGRDDMRKCQELLGSLLNAMPEDKYCYRMVDSATGALLYTTADSDYFDRNEKKKWMMTPKGAKDKYLQIFRSLKADPEWEA